MLHGLTVVSSHQDLEWPCRNPVTTVQTFAWRFVRGQKPEKRASDCHLRGLLYWVAPLRHMLALLGAR